MHLLCITILKILLNDLDNFKLLLITFFSTINTVICLIFSSIKTPQRKYNCVPFGTLENLDRI